jgi:hypothetical protein
MSTKISLSIYSGRNNPQYSLSEEEEKELAERLKRLQRRHSARVYDACPDGFGSFRVISTIEERRSHFLCGGGLVEFPLQPFSYHDDGEIALFLLRIIPKKEIRGELVEGLQASHVVQRLFFRPMYSHTRSQPCGLNMTSDAQPYDPLWGSEGEYPFVSGTICNNCYDYANNQKTRTRAQPGLGSGQLFDLIICDNIMQPYGPINAVGNAAVRDGLVKVKNCTDKLGPGQGWYVALFIDIVNNEDYHWLKQDSSGCWSHKMGINAISNVDLYGEPIVDPETANVNYGSPWARPGQFAPRFTGRQYSFCGYYRTNANVTILGIQEFGGCTNEWW